MNKKVFKTHSAPTPNSAPSREIAIILWNIRSAQNVGSIFRTADAVGVNRVYLVGYTPTPIDKFGRPRKDIAKTALGAEKTISWEHFSNFSSLLKKIPDHQIIAIEQSPKSIDYRDVKIPLIDNVGKTLSQSVAFIVGNEVEGLSESVLKKCHIIAEIPMRGGKESLNVSVATGVALFRILS